MEFSETPRHRAVSSRSRKKAPSDRKTNKTSLVSLVLQDAGAMAAITGAVEVAVTVVLLVWLEVLLPIKVEVKEVLALVVEVIDLELLELLVLLETVELAVVLDVVPVMLREVVEPELLDVLLVVVLAGGPAARAVAFKHVCDRTLRSRKVEPTSPPPEES